MKNSLSQYLECQHELYGRQALTCDHGFIVYKSYEDLSVYAHLIYIEPEARDKGVGSELLGKLIQLTNAKTVFSYVDTTTLNTEDSLAAHLAYGFKIYEIVGNSIQLVLELNKGGEDNE